MCKRKRLKSMIALVLAATMAMTGPTQSMGYVHAEETAVEETASVETEAERVDDAEVQAEEQTQTVVETVSAKAEAEAGENEASKETEAAKAEETQNTAETSVSETEEVEGTESVASTEEVQTDSSTMTEISEENTEETVSETETEEMTDTSDDLKISGTDMNKATALVVGKNEITISKDDKNKAYYFEPTEDGAYYVELTYDDYSCRLNPSEVKRSLFFRESKWDYETEELFVGKAGERVYFQPCFDDYYYDDDEYGDENLTTKAVIEVRSAKKGTASKDSNGQYTLSGDGVNLLFSVDVLNTTIKYQAENKDKEDEKTYYLYAYCSGEMYGKETECYLYRGNSSEGYFSRLDINEAYHIDYVLYSYDGAFAYFGGTGEIFDLTTKNTDKTGGEITNITADFASITVDYELFAADVDTSGTSGWIRYKKESADEWEYDEIWVDDNQTYGSWNIFYIDMDTRYIIELVSRDKKTVYDSKQITTGKYEGNVTASVNMDSISKTSAGIDIKGYDAKDETVTWLETYFRYTDDAGRVYQTSDSTSASSEQYKSGTVTHQLSGLKTGTEYKDVKVFVRQTKRTSDYRYQYSWIYAGSVAFTTKSSSIREEDISAEITPIGPSTAEVKVTVKGIPVNETLYLECRYGLKDIDSYVGTAYLTSDANTVSFTLRDLEETDYRFQFTIDGVVKTQEYRFVPKAVEGEAKAAVKVTKTYVNAFELEASLTGVAADSADVYRCRFQRYAKGGWYGWQEITLDPEKAVTKQIWCDSGTKERWRYVVLKNYEEYAIEYLDVSETQTKTLELDITSVESDEKYLNITAQAKNWADALKEEYGRTYLEIQTQIKKKGEGKWKAIGWEDSFGFDENGIAEDRIRLCEYDNDSQIYLDPAAQYELRFVSYDDDSVVYGETTFKPAASWEVPEESHFVYNGTNTRRSITISGNYEKPTVTVENDNIVSVKEIRQSRIYLDVHSVGSTTLDVTADGITKTITVTVSPAAQMLFFFEGADKTLADLKLPAQYTWVNPSEAPKADKENPIQYFDVTIKEGEETKYGQVPVAVSTLTEDGIEIEGKDTIGFGKEGTYSVTCTGTGYVENFYAEAQAYEIAREWTGDDGLEIIGDKTQRNVTVKGTKSGAHELTLTVTVRNFQTGNTLVHKKAQKLNVLSEGQIDNIIIRPAQEQPENAIPAMPADSVASGYIVTGSVVSGQVIDIDCEDLDLSKNNQIKFEAKTDKGQTNEAGEPVLEDITVQWASADEELLAVENGVVTVKGRGEGRLTITAQDDGKYTVPLLFRIYNHAPVFDSAEITVRDGNSEGTRLAYQEEKKNRVTNITLTGSDKLELKKHISNNDWYLRTKTGAGYTEETTEQITLHITTENKKTYEQSLTVQILLEPKISADADASTGTVTFSQTAIPNLFYVNAEAVFDVSDSYENYEIEDIRTIEKDKDAANFHVKRYDAAKKTIVLTANKLDTSTVASYAAKNSTNAVANVEVKFKGYDGYYPKDGNGIKIQVAVQNKPVSALKAEDAFLTNSINTACIDALDKKTVFDLSGSSLELVSDKTKAENITVAVENGSLRLTQTGENAKGGKYTINVSNPNWTKVLTLTGKILKVDVKKLTMKASKTKATLNTKYNDTVKINLSVKGNASLPVVLDTEVKPVTDALSVKASADNKSIVLSAAEGKTLASGKYTISVAGKIGEEKTKVTKITLTVTDKAPEVKLSAKGSINILNRDLSGITYTAAVNNTDAEITAITLTGEDMLRFKAVKNSGKQFTLKALKDAEALNTKNLYEVKFKMTLSNGAVIENTKGTTVKVKPVDKLPKVKIDAPKKPTISKTEKNGVAVKLTMDAGYRIERIELDGNDKEKFTVKKNGQDAFTISLAENADSISPKAYSLKYKVYFIGANSTTKPLTKSIKITVQ